MQYQIRRPEHLGKFLHVLSRGGGNYEAAHELAMEARDTGTAAAISKAAAASMTGATWGSELGGLAQVRRDFVSAIVEASVLGSIGRAVPPRTRIIGPGTGATSAWVAEGGAVLASELALTEDRVEPRKIASMVLATREMLSGNAAEVEAFLAEELIAESVRQLDSAFLSPGNAGVAGLMPRSITNGATQTAATGDLGSAAGVTALKADIRNMLAAYAGSWAAAALVGSNRLLAALGMEQILAGIAEHIPVVASGSVPGDGGSPEADILILVDRKAIRYSTPEVAISVASQGALVLAGSGPDSVVPTPQSSTSLFEAGCIAMKAEVVTGWSQPPAGSVVVLSGIARA